MANSRFVELIDLAGINAYGYPAITFTVQLQINSWQDGHTWKLLSSSGAYTPPNGCQEGVWDIVNETYGNRTMVLLNQYGGAYCRLTCVGPDYFMYFPTNFEPWCYGGGNLMGVGTDDWIPPNVYWSVIPGVVDGRYVWFGFGSKLGAMAVVGGGEDGIATMYNLSDFSQMAEIKYRVTRKGAGVGGAAGAFFGIVTGALSAGQMVGAPCGGLDFSLSVLGDIDSVFKVLKSKGYLKTLPWLAQVAMTAGKISEDQ